MRKFVPDFLLDFYYLCWPALGAFLYGFPSKKLIVVAVTGTNGKSTVVDMCHSIFEEAGFKTASASSVRFKIGAKERPNLLKMTMPGRIGLQRFLKEAVDAGCKYAVLEVTSEGIKQQRHRFIEFDVAALTNLTPEHIESHGGFNEYRAAKGELFKKLKINRPKNFFGIAIPKVFVVNFDDENANYFFNFHADEKYGYRIKTGKKSVKIEKPIKIIEIDKYKSSPRGFQLQINGEKTILPLFGRFNLYNFLAATCIALSQGIDLSTIKKSIQNMHSVPGRMEIVTTKLFKVVVDYAHTPDALIKVYQAMRDLQTSRRSKLICILGSAGGGRDKWKRPEMGKIAARNCDRIILTDEDPYDEDPHRIISQIESGISNFRPSIFKILDRREAIRKALAVARKGDMVIITGKGSEPWMCLARGKKIPWDDRKIVLEEMRIINKKRR